MGSSILPLHQTACTVIVRTLLDRYDAHSVENRRMGRLLVKQLESNVYASVSSDVLKTFVKKYPLSLTSELLLLLAPPHLRVMDLTRCHNIGKHESDLQALKQALSKCSNLQSLILNEMERCDGSDTEAFMEAIVDTVPQLTSISLEDMNIQDRHVQILLRGLPRLTSINLSMCAGLTDDVFFLSQNQLSELKTSNDFTPPLSHLASVDLSGCQKLTNACIRHLLELCGSNIRNLNVPFNQMDCTVLWYLSGYSLSSTVRLALQSMREHGDSNDGSAARELLQNMKTLQERLDEIQRRVEEDDLQSGPSDVDTALQDNLGEEDVNNGSMVTTENDSEGQTDVPGTSSVAGNSLEECLGAGAGSCSTSCMVSDRMDCAGTRDGLKDLDSVASSQLEALDVNPDEDCNMLTHSKGGKSRLTSDLEIDSEAEICSLPKTGHELKYTGEDKGICDIADVNLEVDSNRPKSQGKFDSRNTAKDDEASSPRDWTNMGACSLLKSSRSDELSELYKDNDEVCAASDVNMNVMTPDSTNDQCQMCGYTQSYGRSCENTGLTFVPYSVPSLTENCNVESSGFSAAAETSSYHTETTHLRGEGCSPLTDKNVPCSSQTAKVDASICRCLVDTRSTMDNDDTQTDLFLEPRQNLEYDPTLSAAAMEILPVDASSSSQPAAEDDGNICKCLSNSSAIEAEGNEIPTDLSSELKADPTLSAAAMPILPRLFQPNMLSLNLCFRASNLTVFIHCLEEYFSVNRNMQKLSLSQKYLTNDMLAVISENVKELRHFSMCDCPEISNEGLASFLKGCPRLQYLDIQGSSHVGDRGIYPLFELGDESRLSVIKLAETCITDITLNRIATTIGPKLEELVLLWCEDITDTGLQKIALHCPSLKTFLLRQGTVRSETLQAFFDNCPNLKDVGLSSISCIGGDLMQSMAIRLKRLVTLDVSWNSDVTNQAVSATLSSCPVLSQLLLCGVKQITDKPFLSIIANYSKWKRCQILIQLKLREQKLRRDTGMAQLSSDEEFEDLYVPHRSTSYAPSLQELNLSFCDYANDKRLQEIVAVCRGTLTVIDYYGINISPKLLHSL